MLAAATVLCACLFAASAHAATVPVQVTPAIGGGPGLTFTPSSVTVSPTDVVLISWSGLTGFHTLVAGDPATCTPTINSPSMPLNGGGGSAPLPPPPTPGTYHYFDPNNCFGPNPSSLTVVVSNPTQPQTPPQSPTTGLTATVAVAQQFKSVTVSTNAATFGSCSGGSSSGSTLGFPNGNCTTANYNVTNNGSVPEGIDVQGSDMVPSDSGTHWTLAGASVTPGLNQFQLHTNSNQYLTNSLQADSTAGVLQPNSSASEVLFLVGPTASGDPSPSFSTAVTYTAF